VVIEGFDNTWCRTCAPETLIDDWSTHSARSFITDAPRFADVDAEVLRSTDG
jgi:hypothetical protein